MLGASALRHPGRSVRPLERREQIPIRSRSEREDLWVLPFDRSPPRAPGPALRGATSMR